MKIVNIMSLFMLTLLIGTCSSSKKTTNDVLFNTTWELEYLSGPRIAFEGIYPDRKPIITFNASTNKVVGNNSCNGYSATYKMNADAISFGDPGITTTMYCGEGELFFLNTMKKINKYQIDSEGKLNLLMDDVVMMRFKKIAKDKN